MVVSLGIILLFIVLFILLVFFYLVLFSISIAFCLFPILSYDSLNLIKIKFFILSFADELKYSRLALNKFIA